MPQPKTSEPYFLYQKSYSAKNLTNITNEKNEEEDDFYQIILSCIIFFGLLGNCISLVAIFHSRLRKVCY